VCTRLDDNPVYAENGSTFMSTRLYDAFEVCLAAMATGVDLESCLYLYPELQDELRPALEATRQARSTVQQDRHYEAMKRSRTRFLNRAAELRSRPRLFIFSFALSRLTLVALSVLIVIAASLNGLVVASAKTLPGDALYPVKRAAENVSLSLARDREFRQQMEQSYQHRRTEEIRSLLVQKRVRNISMEGVVSATTPQQLVVNGIPVRLKAGATVIGEVQPGRVVEVEGQTQPGGWIEADELHLRFYEYAGKLTAIDPGSWTVSTQEFLISPSTRIDPALEVGDRVLVLVYSSDDGNDYAQAILRLPETIPGGGGFAPIEIEFMGTVTAIAGDTLTVDDKLILFNDETEFKGAVSTGLLVKVHAMVAADGRLTAYEVENIAPPESSSGSTPQDDPDESSMAGEPEDQETASPGSGDEGDDEASREDQLDNPEGETGSSGQSGEDQDSDSDSGSGEGGSAGDEDNSGDDNDGNDEPDEDHSGDSSQDD
jgi:hypothetical protein